MKESRQAEIDQESQAPFKGQGQKIEGKPTLDPINHSRHKAADGEGDARDLQKIEGCHSDLLQYETQGDGQSSQRLDYDDDRNALKSPEFARRIDEEGQKGELQECHLGFELGVPNGFGQSSERPPQSSTYGSKDKNHDQGNDRFPLPPQDRQGQIGSRCKNEARGEKSQKGGQPQDSQVDLPEAGKVFLEDGIGWKHDGRNRTSDLAGYGARNRIGHLIVSQRCRAEELADKKIVPVGGKENQDIRTQDPAAEPEKLFGLGQVQ